MKVVEKTGKTVEEAIADAIEDLGITRDLAKVEVLEEAGKKGFFGLLGARLAKVRVTYDDDPGSIAMAFIQSVCAAMDVEAQLECVEKESHLFVNISGSELGILIGRRGDTLEALQFITNLAVSKRLAERIKITIDIEGYRERREDTLTRLAKRLCEKVKRTGSRVVLEPMNPHERRIIHTALQDETRITTYSEGEDPNRRVVISLKRTRDIS